LAAPGYRGDIAGQVCQGRRVTEMMIALDGGEVWADDSGGDGPPLVLLHPGIGDSRVWDPLLPALTADYRVIRYDARGYGRSPAPTTRFTLLADLIAVLDHLALDRTAVVGCSQGGGSALGLALAQPERVRALVLLCPGIPGYAWPDDPAVGAAFERAIPDGVDAVAEVMLGLWAAAGRTDEVMEQLRSGARAGLSNDAFEEEDPPVLDRLGEIAVPTSLMVGDADRPALIDSNRLAAARIPGCALIEVPGLDHLPPLRVPDLVLEQIRTTLSRPAGNAASSRPRGR
jgi:3-oxoadipate enol-lactonase